MWKSPTPRMDFTISFHGYKYDGDLADKSLQRKVVFNDLILFWRE